MENPDIVLDLFQLDKKELNKYNFLSRRPIILEEDIHIDNIVKYFIPLKIPYEIKYNIGKYILYYSKDINLKILDYLIKYDDIKYINNLILTNNNIEYIKNFLNKCNYNLLFFHYEYSWYGNIILVKLLNIKYYNKYLLIFTNNNRNYSKTWILDELSFIKGNRLPIDKYKNEHIETCFNLDFFTMDIIKFEEYMFNEHYDYFIKSREEILKIYNNINEKTLKKILYLISNKIMIFDDYMIKDKSVITDIVIDDDILNNKYINIKDFAYLLIKYIYVGFAIIIIIEENYIIFGCPSVDHDWSDNLHTVFLFEINKDGSISIPNYSFNEIINEYDKRYEIKLNENTFNKNLISIYEFINCNILILNN